MNDDEEEVEWVTSSLRDGIPAGATVGMLVGQVAWGIPNGTRIRKVAEEEGDMTPIGGEGVVLSSVYDPAAKPNVFYFVMWDHTPGVPVGVIDWKVAPVA